MTYCVERTCLRGAKADFGHTEAGQAVSDAQLVCQAQVAGPEEAAGEMEWGGQDPSLEPREPAIGSEEVDRGLAAEQGTGTHALAKVGQIGAAGHAHVLAVIDQLAGGGILERASAAAEAGAALEQGDPQAASRQRSRRREPGQPTAHDQDAGRQG